ncbi:MAG: primosomal protein N' [Desulfitobacterium sp.]|nr:primosomal protein N' [Desulfitobacterium sp.]
MLFAEVLVDVANRRLDHGFHYSIPRGMKVKKGMRVIVPLNYRQVQGIIVNISDTLPQEVKVEKVKPILKTVDGIGVPEEFIELALWLAETTICSVGQSLHTVWPLLKGKVEEWVIPLASKDDEDVQALKILDEETYQALAVLFRSRRKALPMSTYLKRSGLKKPQVEKLVKEGWLRLESRFTSILPKSLATMKEGDLGSLVEPTVHELTLERQLTEEQERAYQEIQKALDEKTHKTMLLHGVTGSGKTEVYYRSITHVVEQGGSAILLVPEISLTSQLARVFQERFGENLVVLHSSLQPREKAKAWQKMLSGQISLVIGARSAVFAPLPNLQLIILDEEHETAYQQDENPKYHARNIARKRMADNQGIVLLGSATPSLEVYGAAQKGKVSLLTMDKRVAERPLPPVEIVDMREELIRGNRNIFSLSLQGKIKKVLERGEQAMLFLNRRGYATFVICRECGYVVRCQDCDISLTYHTQGHIMRCHYCNHEEVPPRICPECGSRYIRFFGQGTQQVEEGIKGLYPEARVLRLDFDTTRQKGAYEEILGKFRRQEGDVLVGTQMMAKGLDFPNVTLVGVVAADQMLNLPDFRARERTFQLLTQVAGRAGRSKKPGEVVFQTYSPLDRAIQKASLHDYKGFFWEELGYRKVRNYPPFTHVIRVTLLHEKEERVIKGAHILARSLKEGILYQKNGNTPLDILGPAPAVLPRLKNEFRWQVSVKGKDLNLLRKFLHEGVQRYSQETGISGIKLNIEVDPLGL